MALRNPSLFSTLLVISFSFEFCLGRCVDIAHSRRYNSGRCASPRPKKRGFGPVRSSLIKSEEQWREEASLLVISDVREYFNAARLFLSRSGYVASWSNQLLA